jgi:hypothetical protein
MFTKINRTIRKAMLGAILAGATIFSAPTTGCDASAVKDVGGNAARPTGYIYQPWSWER